MREQIIERLEQNGVIVKKSTIHQRLGPPGCWYIQIIVNGVELNELACPHFLEIRHIQKWCERHPDQTSNYKIETNEQENQRNNPVSRPVRKSVQSTAVGIVE